jgi:hypothetical protein
MNDGKWKIVFFPSRGEKAGGAGLGAPDEEAV